MGVGTCFDKTEDSRARTLDCDPNKRPKRPILRMVFDSQELRNYACAPLPPGLKNRMPASHFFLDPTMTQQIASTYREIRAETGGFVNTGIINVHGGVVHLGMFL